LAKEFAIELLPQAAVDASDSGMVRLPARALENAVQNLALMAAAREVAIETRLGGGKLRRKMGGAPYTLQCRQTDIVAVCICSESGTSSSTTCSR
jgi:hypothetical protein